MDYCNTSGILQTIYTIKIVLKILFVVIPIIIIINAIIRTAHIATNNSNAEEIKKNVNILIKNVIAGIIIFIIPSFVTYILGLADNTNDMSYCINEATIENIKRLKQEELEALRKETLDEQKEQSSAIDERKKNEKDVNESIKNQREQSLKNNATPGINSNTSSSGLQYWEFIPDNPKKNMALIVFLHGSGECGNLNSMLNVSFPKFMNEGYYKSYNAVFLAPNTASCSWTSDASKVKALIDEKVAQYSIDPKHIIITGHSLGGNGTWNMVAQYPGFFSAAVSVSGCPNANAERYVGIPIRSYVGSAEGTYQSCNAGKVNQINSAGGNVDYIVVPNANHSTVVNIYKDSELINWMLTQ